MFGKTSKTDPGRLRAAAGRHARVLDEQPLVEHLEERRVLAITYANGVALVGSTLFIEATRGADVITVSKSGANLLVSTNGKVSSTPLSSISKIRASMGAGADTFSGHQSTSTVAIAMSIDGGRGNDSITTGAGADTISGGDGQDTIVAWGGNDVVNGGGQTDWILGKDGADTISGGDGDDNLYGDNGADVLEGGNGDDYIQGG